ncbi:UDP-glycosyltransferase 76E11, partial [Linum perenne]
ICNSNSFFPTTIGNLPQIPIFPIGPFHKQIPQSPIQTLTDEETDTIGFLDIQPPNSVLYISFGSIAVHTRDKVLSHEAVRGFWTHSGWNSTIEATAKGVPMMCRPWFADQPVNARQVTEVWGIGIEVEKDMGGKEGVEKLIRRLMVEEEGEGIRKKALELKEEIMESLAAVVAALVIYLKRRGGSAAAAAAAGRRRRRRGGGGSAAAGWPW